MFAMQLELAIHAVVIGNTAIVPVWQQRLAKSSLWLIESVLVTAVVAMILLRPPSKAASLFLAIERWFAKVAPEKLYPSRARDCSCFASAQLSSPSWAFPNQPFMMSSAICWRAILSHAVA
jgi:hypothetical protein